MSQFKDQEELDSSLRYANDSVQNQLTAELVQAMTEKCFKQCITAPTDYLTTKEERCLDACNDKFLSSRQLIAELYAASRSR